MTFIEQFKAARRVSTPLIAIQTPDPSATIESILKLEDVKTPVVSWDIVRGLIPIGNPPGVSVKALTEACGETPATSLTNPAEALAVGRKLPQDTIFFFHNAQLFLSDPTETPSIVQGIWNLRDVYKRSGATLVMLVNAIKLSGELQDVLVLDEALPNENELKTIVTECFASANMDVPTDGDFEKTVEALSGLSAFTAEQTTMMSLNKELESGISVAEVWERKRQAIEQTPGLSVWRGTETFNDIGGVDNIKTFLTQVMTGKDAPNVVLFFDEIEKAVAGSGGGDLSGNTQEMTGTFLSWAEDTGMTGIIGIGPPGCSKSMIGKAAGTTFGKPTLVFDFSGMKGSLVGQSGQNLRRALKVVDAISNKKVLCIATCNKIAELPPELRRRFSFGTFFFDLPVFEERIKIWDLYVSKYRLNASPADLPNHEGWTGAEIKQCTLLSYRLGISLKQASAYIVPVAKSSAESIEKLRNQAAGRFISAAKPGVYVIPVVEATPQPIARRKVIDATTN